MTFPTSSVHSTLRLGVAGLVGLPHVASNPNHPEFDFARPYAKPSTICRAGATTGRNNNKIVFAKFPHFPIEIRSMIWGFALASASTVEVAIRLPPSPSIGSNDFTYFGSTNGRPTLLWVNHELRGLAIKSKKYSLLLGVPASLSIISLDFETDILLLNIRSRKHLTIIGQHLVQPGIVSIKHLALPYQFLTYDYDILDEATQILSRFPNLETLTFLKAPCSQNITRRLNWLMIKFFLIVELKRRSDSTIVPKITLEELDNDMVEYLGLDRPDS